MLSFTETGSGSPIVFLHGLGLNRNFWSSTIAHLSQSHRCIAIDLPGHGESRAHTVNGTMSAYAAAVREVIEQKQLSSITLVGHSMGGQIAMILALQMPAVITKLVLVCAAGIETFTPDEREKMRAGGHAIWRNPVTEDMLKRVYASIDRSGNYSLVSEHLEQQRHNFRNFSELLCNSISGMLDEPVYDFLSALTQPTLCIFGGADAGIPNRYLHPQMSVQDLVQAAQKKIPQCTAEIFPKAGHYLPVEYPQELANKIQSL
jgi:pimeloyl-ACP methyl ester carboxylesterase